MHTGLSIAGSRFEVLGGDEGIGPRRNLDDAAVAVLAGFAQRYAVLRLMKAEPAAAGVQRPEAVPAASAAGERLPDLGRAGLVQSRRSRAVAWEHPRREAAEHLAEAAWQLARERLRPDRPAGLLR